jgi:CYTH domain-containing protein
MPVEIERKFLIDSCLFVPPPGGQEIVQGYICQEAGRTVRVRLRNGVGTLTVKGPSKGATRAEFEYEIPADDAKDLLQHCDGRLVRKTRHRIVVGEHTWDVDIFAGDNAPLLLAEVELDDEEEAFETPPWLGAEVTEDMRFANYALACSPYASWPKE